MKVSSLSIEYLRVQVSAEQNGVPVDPTGTAPQWSFEDYDTNPDPTTWNDGDWETYTIGGQTFYFARLLLGQGNFDVAPGRYYLWLKVTGNPEVPVRRVGVVLVD